MYIATNARDNSILNVGSFAIETEIALINLNIIIAVQNGLFTTTINNTTQTVVVNAVVTGTPMTTDTAYFDVWQNNATVDSATSQRLSNYMQQVIDYYTKLGYTVYRKSTDGAHFYWQINW
jgi:hypothetical protein